MNDFDPKTNRIQFGLMTEEAKWFLKAWPYGWEFYDFQNDRWEAILSDPAWYKAAVHRGKTAPVVTSRFAAIYPHAQMGSWRDNIHDVMKAGGADMIGIIQLDITDGVPSTKILEVKK